MNEISKSTCNNNQVQARQVKKKSPRGPKLGQEVLGFGLGFIDLSLTNPQESQVGSR